MATGRIDNINILLKTFKLSSRPCNRCIYEEPDKAPEHFVAYPGAVCNKGVNVVLGLVVVKQTAPGRNVSTD